MNQQRLLRRNKRHNFLHTATGIQRFFLLTEMDGTATIRRLRERTFPHERQAGSIDNKFTDTATDIKIHGMLNQRLLEYRDKRFRENMREGSQPSPQTCTKNKCFHETKLFMRLPRCGGGEYGG